MNATLLTAILGTCSSLVVALSSIYLSNRLISYKIDDLTTKVKKHNNFIERVYIVEGKIAEIQNDIKELKERDK